MSLFDEAKHKLEEVAGKVEKTIGGAIGDRAMEFSGEAHEEHGEAEAGHDHPVDHPDDESGAPA